MIFHLWSVQHSFFIQQVTFTHTSYTNNLSLKCEFITKLGTHPSTWSFFIHIYLQRRCTPSMGYAAWTPWLEWLDQYKESIKSLSLIPLLGYEGVWEIIMLSFKQPQEWNLTPHLNLKPQEIRYMNILSYIFNILSIPSWCGNHAHTWTSTISPQVRVTHTTRLDERQ